MHDTPHIIKILPEAAPCHTDARAQTHTHTHAHAHVHSSSSLSASKPPNAFSHVLIQIFNSFPAACSRYLLESSPATFSPLTHNPPLLLLSRQSPRRTTSTFVFAPHPPPIDHITVTGPILPTRSSTNWSTPLPALRQWLQRFCRNTSNPFIFRPEKEKWQ